MRIPRSPFRRNVFGALLFSVSVAACGPAPEVNPADDKSPDLGTSGQDVIYGDDHRTDVYAYTAIPAMRERAERSTVALMDAVDIDATNPDNVIFNAPTLQSYFNLCSDQRFLQDPTPAWCSGTLIDDDLVLTAGHCIRTAAECAGTRFVFNFYRTSETGLQTVTTDDIYACQAIVARQQGIVNGRNLDWAIVRLDRPAAPRFEPAPIRPGNEALPLDTSVTVIGSGSGIPFKIDDGGWVRDARASTLDYFVANTDTFGGNSGSGVYENETFTVAGILVRGAQDYVARGSCNVVNQCTDTGCRGEDITYVRPAVEGYCAVAGSMRLCGRSEPPPPPPPPPAPPSNPFTYNATATNSAQTNTTNYTIALEQGQTLTIATCGLPGANFTGDTYLRLHNAYGAEVAANDDACGGRGSSITFTAAVTGDYIIAAGCFSSGTCSGSVAWTITGGNDPDPEPEPEPEPETGAFTYRARTTNSAMRNYVSHEFTLAAGQTLTVATCGVTGASSNGDTYLRLNVGADEVAENDDACGIGGGSRVTYTATAATTVELRGGCYGSGRCVGNVVWTIQ